MSRSVIDVPLFSEIYQAKYNLSILRLSEVDVLSDNRVKQVIIRIALPDEFWGKNGSELLSHLQELLDV